MKYVGGELVFAFGSNLSVEQMAQRCPSWEYVARAELPGHELVFAGYSMRWDGAVATFMEASRRRVRGIVYSVSPRDLQRLDGFENAPHTYERRRVVVQVRKRLLPVHTYQLTGFDSLGVPSPDYVAVIARAYRDWGFDRRHLVRAVRAAGEQLNACDFSDIHESRGPSHVDIDSRKPGSRRSPESEAANFARPRAYGRRS